MDLSPRSALVIRPMGVGGVIDAGISLARKNFLVLARTTAIGLAPFYVISTIVGALIGNGSGVARLAQSQSIALVVSGIVAGIILAILFLLALIATVIACSRLIGPTVQVDELQPSVLYRAAWGRLGRIILWWLVIGVCCITFIVPPLGMYLLLRWGMSYYPVVIDGAGPFRALGRSWNLTRRSWWHTFGTFFVGSFVVGFVIYVIFALFSAVGIMLTIAGGAAAGSVVDNLGSYLGTILGTPFSTAIGVVLYYELRARNEGFDLLMRAEQAGELR